MNRLLGSGLGFAGAALLASLAHAEERLNEAGRFTVGAERLFGVAWDTETESLNGSKTTTSETSVSLLTKQASSPFSASRIGFDYFVIDGLSVGAALGYSSVSESVDSGGTSRDLLSLHGFLFAPRVGYAYMFAASATFVPSPSLPGASRRAQTAVDDGVQRPRDAEQRVAFNPRAAPRSASGQRRFRVADSDTYREEQWE